MNVCVGIKNRKFLKRPPPSPAGQEESIEKNKFYKKIPFVYTTIQRINKNKMYLS